MELPTLESFSERRLIRNRIRIKLRNYKSFHGCYNRDIALVLGITTHTVDSYMHGRRQPGLDVAVDIAKMLGITIDSLVNDDVAARVF